MADNASPVLVVDDDDAIRDGLLELLDEGGFRAVGARNGAEALELLRRLTPRPSLVLLDLMMPVMDGTTFLREQRRDADLARIPVVVMSAFPNARATARDLATDFLPKPLSFDRILALAAAHCGC